MWFQLRSIEPITEQNQRSRLGYRCPILVQVFHQAPSRQETPEVPSAPSGQHKHIPPEPILDCPEGAEEKVDVVALPIGTPDWSSFDLGRSLRLLRSDNAALITRSLRQLHLRWWHASYDKMRSILQNANVPKQALDLLRSVCDSCAICRQWVRPGNRSVPSASLATKFNEAVQADLLFITDKIVLHEVLPPSDVDKCRAARQARQEILVEKTFCFGREWQQAHEDIAVREKRRQCIPAAEALRPLDGMK